MVTKWQLDGIKSVNPTTMSVRISEYIDGVFKETFTKQFSKTLSQEDVLSQLALLVKQKRQLDLDSRLPYKILDLSDFENRVDNL